MVSMPSRRSPVRGRDLDGDEVELSVGVARKLYFCPGCRERIEIGAEHVIVDRSSMSHHQHWHTDCARPIARELSLAEG